MISKARQIYFKLRRGWVEASPRGRKTFAIALLILLGALWMVRRNMAGGIQLEPAEVKYLASFVDEVRCVTRPKAAAETYLSVQYGGRLDSVLKKAGDSVKVGDMIAIVDKTANAAGLKSALSGFKLAQSDYGRASRLFSSGSVTREEFDSAQSKLDVKRAELEQAKQRVEDSIVRSPIDGVVSVVVFKEGDKVPDGGRIAAVEDPRGTLALCRFPSEVAGSFSADAAPTERPSKWTMIEGTSDGAKEQLSDIPVRVRVDQAQGGFQGLEVDVRLETYDPKVKKTVGQLTEITLPLPEKQNVAQMPSLAVVRRAGGAFVLVEERKGQYRWSQISIVKQTPKETVASGISEGSKIFMLKDDLSKIEAYVQKHSAN